MSTTTPAMGVEEMNRAHARFAARVARGVRVEKMTGDQAVAVARAMWRAELEAGQYEMKEPPREAKLKPRAEAVAGGERTKGRLRPDYCYLTVNERGDLEDAFEMLERLQKEKTMATTKKITKAGPGDDMPGRGGALDGANHRVQEFDVGEVSDRDVPEYAVDATSDEYRDAVSQRLGDMHVVSVRPPMQREFDVADLSVARPDPFLRGSRDSAYVGGVERSGEGGRFYTKEPGAYTYGQPDADHREDPTDHFDDPTEDDVIAGPANFSAPRPGRVGGVPVVVRKRTQGGLFASAVFGARGDSADSFLS